VWLPLDHPNPVAIANKGGLYYFSLTHIDTFVLGAVAGAVYLRRGMHGVESPRAMTALFVASVLSAGLLAFWWQVSIWPPYVWYSPLIYTPIALSMACLVYAVVANPNACYARPLRWYPLRVFGLLSYGIYLVHVVVMLAVRQRVAGGNVDAMSSADLALCVAYVLAGTVCVAAGLHVLIERPFLRLKGRPLPSARQLTSTTVPWRRCMLVGLGACVVIEALFWSGLTSR
jgi:peptidoglycan/LPS O-acetylase OafA/YrhL